MTRILQIFIFLVSVVGLNTLISIDKIDESVADIFIFDYSGPTEIIVNEDCQGDLNWGHPQTVQVIYDGPGQLVYFQLEEISGGYSMGDKVSGGETVYISYLAKDDKGNSEHFTFFIDFVDVTPPLLDPVTNPDTLIVNCIDLVPDSDDIVVSDNCDPSGSSVIISINSDAVADACAAQEFSRTITAIDIYGNSSSLSQFVIVKEDTLPPVITVFPSNQSGQCDEIDIKYPSWLSNELFKFRAIDDGCGEIEYYHDAPKLSEVRGTCGPIHVNFTAEDKCGNTVSTEAVFTIVDDTAPVFTRSATDLIVDCGIASIEDEILNWLNSYGGAEAEDNCSDVSWSHTPDTLDYADACNEPLKVNFIATDECGNRSFSTAYLEIQDTSAPRIISEPGLVVKECNMQSSLSEFTDFIHGGSDLEFDDYCSSFLGVNYRYLMNQDTLSEDELIDEFLASLDQSCGEFIYENDTLDRVVGVITYRVLVSNICGNSSLSKEIHYLVRDTSTPIILQRGKDKEFYCADQDSLLVEFNAWYDIAAEAIVEDNCGDLVMSSWPTRDSLLTLFDGDELTCGIEIPVYFSFTDNCGNTIEDSFPVLFSIVDTVPPTLLVMPENMTVSCTEDYNTIFKDWINLYAYANVVDACSEASWLYFSFPGTDGYYVRSEFHAVDMPDYVPQACRDSLGVNFVYADRCNNLDSFVAYFHIIDTIPPQVINFQDTITVDCNEIPTGEDLEIVQSCPFTLDIQIVDEIVQEGDSEGCAYYEYMILRQYIISDNCDYFDTLYQVIQLYDNSPPTFTVPEDITVECGTEHNLDISGRPTDIFDACGSPVTISYEDSLLQESCPVLILRKWVAVDLCLNESIQYQEIEVIDSQAPFYIENPIDTLISCAEDIEAAFTIWVQAQLEKEAMDSCGLAGRFAAFPDSYDQSDIATFPTDSPQWSDSLLCAYVSGDTVAMVELDFVLYDDCVNTAISRRAFYIIDTIPPEVENCPTDTILYSLENNCGNYYEVPEIIFSDQCTSGHLSAFLIFNADSIEYNPSQQYRYLLPKGITEFLLTVQDCGGNMTECYWRVEVLDTIAPVIECNFDEIYLVDNNTCTKDVRINRFIASDNCDITNVDREFIIHTYQGDTIRGSLPEDEFVNLGIGKHAIEIIVTDKSGNSASCHSIIEVIDGLPPVAVCKPAFIEVFPDGLPVQVSAEMFDLNSSANCGIDTMWLSEDTFDCSRAGEAVDITLYVRNISGLVDSCTTVGQVELARVIPSFTLDLCHPDTLQLFANTPGGDVGQYHFTWSGPGNFSSSEENPRIYNIDSSYSGTYTLEIRGPSGCAISGSIDVNIKQMGEPRIYTAADTICQKEALVLESNSYSGAVTYSWYEGLPPDGILIGTSTVPVFELSPILGAHSYYVVVSNDMCTTEPSRSLKLEVVDVPVAQVARAYVQVCEGGEIKLESRNTNPGISYLWQGPNGFTSIERAPIVSNSAEINHKGFYTLTVALGECVSEAITVEVEVNTLPAIPSIEGDSIVCHGEEFRLSTSNPRQYDNYIWENAQGHVYETDVPVLIVSTATNLHKGGWTVTVDDGICPSVPSEVFSLDVKDKPDVRVFAPKTVCEGDEIYLSAESNDDLIDYIWLNPEEDTLKGSDVIFPAIEGLYVLYAISEFACEYTEAMYINIVPKPTVTALSSTAPACIETVADITFEPTVFPPDDGSYTYQWLYNDDVLGQDSILVITSASILDTGMYKLVVKDGNCTSDTFEYDLKMNQTPAKPSFINDNFFCEGDSIILSLDEYIGEDVSYIFRFDNADYSVNEPYLNLGILPAGNHTASLRVSVDGCVSRQSDLLQIHIGTVPNKNSISGSMNLCEGEELVLEASGESGVFIWYLDGDSLTSTHSPRLVMEGASLVNSGIYRVIQVVGTCVSEISDAYEVEIHKTPASPVVSEIYDGICVSDKNASLEICLNQSSYEEDAVYRWYHVETSQVVGELSGSNCQLIRDLSMLEDGLNSLIVSAEIGGCTALQNDTVEVVVSKAPDEVAIAGDDIFACSGEFPVLNATEPLEANGMWQALTDTTDLSSYSDPQAKLVQMKTGENILVWSLSYGSCEDFSTDTISVYYDLPPIANNDFYVRPFGSTFNMDILSNDDIMGGVIISIEEDVKNGRTIIGTSSIQYAPYNGFVGLDSLVYKICSAGCPDACSTAIVNIQIGDDSLCDIPTIFTPNDDGTNDYFIIQCLSSGAYPRNTLKVFNQYGDQVFHASPYMNNWKGQYRNGQLPAGTYYYLMDFGDGNEVQKGFIVIEY